MRFTMRLSMLLFVPVSVTVALAMFPARNTEPPPVAALFDCEVPCFLGIIPGETTVDEAEEILRGASVTASMEHTPERNLVTWVSTGSLPHLYTFGENYLTYNPETDVVNHLQVTLVNVSLWDVYSSLVNVRVSEIYTDPFLDGFFSTIHFTGSADVFVNTTLIRCKANLQTFWMSGISLVEIKSNNAPAELPNTSIVSKTQPKFNQACG